MKLVELMHIANGAYAACGLQPLDGYYDAETGEPTPQPHYCYLGCFVIEELWETYDPTARTAVQLREAVRLMQVGADDLLALAAAFAAAIPLSNEGAGPPVHTAVRE